jgi:transposase InsO family protein
VLAIQPPKLYRKRFDPISLSTTDQGTSFMSKEVREFAELYRIKLLNSSPYYAQANGQVESSNRTLVNLIKKKISDNPKHWHNILSEALWAHRISKHSATKVSPFELVYGQEAVLPVEISLNVVRFARQNDLTVNATWWSSRSSRTSTSSTIRLATSPNQLHVEGLFTLATILFYVF